MNIQLHLEHIVLEGLPLGPEHTGVLEEAVRVELTRLLAGRGLDPAFTAGAAVPFLAGGTLHLGGGPSSAAIGRDIGASVYGALGPRG